MKSMNYSLIRTICALVIGLVLVLVPNIIAQWGDITASIGRMTSGEMPVISSETGAFGPALWSAVLYFFFPPFPHRGSGQSAIRTLAGHDAGVLCRRTDVSVGLYPDYGRCAADCLSFDGTSLDARSGRFLCDTGLDPDSGYRSPV